MSADEILSKLLPILLGSFLPWVFSKKIKDDAEVLVNKRLDEKLESRPTEDKVREILEQEVRKQEGAAMDRFATKEAFARLEARIETKLESLASKESVAALSSDVSTLIRLTEKMDKKFDSIFHKQKDTRP